MILPLILLMSFTACGGKDSDSYDKFLTVIDVESALAHLEDELTLSDLYDTVRYVPLETSDSCRLLMAVLLSVLIQELPFAIVLMHRRGVSSRG